MLVVSDTSPISGLFLLGKLDLLPLLFGKIIIPQLVFDELMRLEAFGHPIRVLETFDWVDICVPQNPALEARLRLLLDPGESQAIALAKEMEADFLLIDEQRGRRQAIEIGLRTTGLIGILIQAKQKNYIPLVAPLLRELEEKAGFWMSQSLREQALRLAGEL